ncbi:hypothetical protein CLPUN_42760 [Clostridium puniceum]|uniref:Spo0E like sporulation regulatory protein n=1 Tax=Clostridium puniceum TaxID=29367 RepID=A0A1S8T8K1_9CLOT|nr:hypothetical protein [Clostridium puniceum]OOM73921.1 hypothetical protein CLPUN_42760 [Clostridium puniceum]
MKKHIFSRLKCNILLRKHLLNLLLLFFSPSTKFMIALSQNLDKFIVLYQKELFSSFNHKQNNSKSVKEVAA